MKRHNGSGRDLLDMRQAQEMVRAFSSACAVPCRLLDPEGNAVFPAEQASEQELARILPRNAAQNVYEYFHQDS